jgi:sn1-specific diacylglycerol lipase
MPALRLFGRRWLISSDDLVVPALQLSLFHLAWTVALSIWLDAVHGVSDSECPSKRYYVEVVGALLATCALSGVLLEPGIAFYGSRGGMFETNKRSPKINWFIYIDLLLSIARVCLTGYGTYVLYAHPSQCLAQSRSSFDLQVSYRALIWSMWAMIAGLVCFCVLVYNFFPDYNDPNAWQKQFAYLSYWFCCVSGSQQELHQTFGNIGQLLSMVFRHLDMVPSDVAVIFGLSMMRQRIFRYEEESAALRAHEDLESGPRSISSREILPKPSKSFFLSQKHRALQKIDSRGLIGVETLGQVDQRTVEDVSYYMRYAFAAYGWMLFVWANPYDGALKLCCGRSCNMFADCVRGKDGLPDLRQAKYLNREAILKTSRLDPGDLLFVQLEGSGKDVLPYFIALDHAKKKLIVSIRGSMSFDDCIRDLKFDPVSIRRWLDEAPGGDGPVNPPCAESMDLDSSAEYMAHRGIFEAAAATVDSIHATGLLEKHLSPIGGMHPMYEILVCGHSLGGGCAFLVALYLRRKYKSLKCISFSPPGGLVSHHLAISSSEWCVSTVCGKEWIPRLTLSTIERVRDDMIHLGTHCKMPKIWLILSWMTNYFWSDEDIFYSDNNLPEENSKWFDEYHQSIKADDDFRGSLIPAFDFYPPGKILYMRPTGKTKTKRSPKSKTKNIQREFVCEWTTPENLVSNGIVLSGRMMSDHFPDYSFSVLKGLAHDRNTYVSD